ncbi:hypothetical protein LXL04_018127 [Taraxacum kok-saghyz]
MAPCSTIKRKTNGNVIKIPENQYKDDHHVFVDIPIVFETDEAFALSFNNITHHDDCFVDEPRDDVSEEVVQDRLFDVPPTPAKNEDDEVDVETSLQAVNEVTSISSIFEVHNIPKLRKKSERIIMAKLKKRVVGPSATVDEPVELD